MAEDKTTPEQAAPAAAGRHEQHGPGPLMVYGLVCLAIAAWCAHDLFGSAGSSWEAKGNMGTIWFNYAALTLGAIGAVYFFVLATVRYKKPPSKDASGQP
jgi:TRAP-type C4-dicarboxylate transport system permease small subunit